MPQASFKEASEDQGQTGRRKAAKGPMLKAVVTSDSQGHNRRSQEDAQSGDLCPADTASPQRPCGVVLSRSDSQET